MVTAERCRLSPQQVGTLVLDDAVKVAIKADQSALDLLGSIARTHTARRTLAGALDLDVDDLPGAENAVADQDIRPASGGPGVADSASAPVQGDRDRVDYEVDAITVDVTNCPWPVRDKHKTDYGVKASILAPRGGPHDRVDPGWNFGRRRRSVRHACGEWQRIL